jgi:ubiquinone/menaquinone biosynthesis C-methylase UbiE
MNRELLTQKEQFFDRWAPSYDFLFPSIFYQAIHKRLLEFVELPEQPKVLDIGCGTGRLLTRLATEFPTLQGIGLDLSAQMLQQARERNSHRERLSYQQGDAESLPFSDEEFDAVFSTLSLLHYPNPQPVFAEVCRVLRPSGRFYLVDSTVSKWRQADYLPFSPGGIRLYSAEQREQFGNAVGLESHGHHYLLGPAMLSIFVR